MGCDVCREGRDSEVRSGELLKLQFVVYDAVGRSWEAVLSIARAGCWLES